MRHSKANNMRTKHWRELWQANIAGLQSLKEELSSSTIFVAIDAEPWRLEGRMCSQIGITILAPIDGQIASLPRPTSLESLQENFEFHTHILKIADRRPGKRRREEKRWRGEYALVENQYVEDTIIHILEYVPGFLGIVHSKPSPKPKLCLIGFDLSYELRLLSESYPRILAQFSCWVDMQELVIDAAAAGSCLYPSMKGTLLAFGFKSDKKMLPNNSCRGHSAGNDTVRTIAILLNLLTHRGPLHIKKDESRKGKDFGASLRRKYMADDRFFKARPKPFEAYPFVARLSLPGHQGPLFKKSMKKLYDIFSEYNVIGIGAETPKKWPYVDSVWVCLRNLDDLNRLVVEAQGREFDNGIWKGTWRAISLYDPSLTPVTTAEELKEWLDAREAALLARKVQERKQKRLRRDGFEGSYEYWSLGEDFALLTGE